MYALVTWVLPFLCLELSEALVYLQVVIWAFTAILLKPMTDPYVPKRKLSSCSQWLQSWLKYINDAFDNMAIYLAPLIHVKGGRHQACYRSSQGPVHRKATPRSRAAALMVFSAVTMGVARAHAHCDNATPTSAHRAVFDSDSYGILVDGGATASITNNLDDFVRPPKKTRIRIKGFNGTSSNARVGTVKWPILDDNGVRHILTIPDTYYVESCPMRLLSPQHYSQQIHDHRGTFSTNYGDQVLFVFHKSKFRATMPLSEGTNVGILRSSPGHHVFSCFVEADPPPKEPPPDFFACQVISDEDADNMELEEETESVTSSIAPTGLRGGSTVHPSPASDGPSTVFTGTNLIPENPDIVRPSSDLDSSVKPHGSTPDDAARPDLLPFDLDHDEEETNLSNNDDATSSLDPTSELMRWHLRLGHLPFANIRLMAARKEIPSRLANCRIPRCQSCLYGRATKRPWRTKGQSGTIQPVTVPGQCVSVDQLESPVAGFIGQNKGYFFRKRYKVATIFVDHFSRLSYVYLQESTKGVQTLAAKRSFEAYAASHGVKIKQYHADNGRFAEKLFLNHCELSGQTVSLCGVSAHFQNGIAERRIKDLTERARTSILHAMHRWPSAVTINLWPYALRYINDVYNATPALKSGQTPLERFSSTAVRPKVLDFHPPFCPVYVLHNGLQGSGSRPNKWVRRSRCAVYLGKSPRHSRSVALVLSLLTGYVSAQFHLKHDDFFETVRDLNVLPQSKWQELARFTPEEMQGKAIKKVPGTKGKVQWEPDHSPLDAGYSEEGVPLEEEGSVPQPHLPFDPFDEEGEHPNQEASPAGASARGTTTRSGRQSNPPERFMEMVYAVFDDTDAVEDYELQKEAEDPIAFAASRGDPDTLSYKDAMDAPDSPQFKTAMIKEADDLIGRGALEFWEKRNVPAGHKILSSVWAFRRKRRIDTRKVYKHKARLNIHGGQQTHGVNYWETFSPVVNWFSIRLCMTFTLIFGWSTRQIDFVLAFPQADVECDLFMELPRGLIFEGVDRSTHCVKLIKNLYGQKQAGRVWNDYLVQGLVDRGFIQSKVDECVFYKDTTILLVYVDDAILCGPSSKDIDDIIASLKKDFDVTDEGEIDDYLGVKVTRPTKETIVLRQPHLIQQILDEVGMLPQSKTKDKAAPSSTILRRDLDGSPFQEKWDYRRIIGKLNFLEKSTRPEIAYAVHQCARFASNPRESHANAVKYLCRYLLGTKDEGIILHPDVSKSFEVHVDCDFAGNWVKEDAMDDPSTAKSRTGYVISYAGCPVIWASKLQTEVVLSTTESEYVGLSESLRIAIVMMNLLKEMQQHGVNIPKTNPVVYCKLFEDNAGAIHLAKAPKMRPRTRHINQKYHHFREWVKKGLIEILPIDTKEQPADLLTKPLDVTSFVKHRKAVLGW